MTGKYHGLFHNSPYHKVYVYSSVAEYKFKNWISNLGLILCRVFQIDFFCASKYIHLLTISSTYFTLVNYQGYFTLFHKILNTYLCLDVELMWWLKSFILDNWYLHSLQIFLICKWISYFFLTLKLLIFSWPTVGGAALDLTMSVCLYTNS